MSQRHNDNEGEREECETKQRLLAKLPVMKSCRRKALETIFQISAVAWVIFIGGSTHRFLQQQQQQQTSSRSFLVPTSASDLKTHIVSSADEESTGRHPKQHQKQELKDLVVNPHLSNVSQQNQAINCDAKKSLQDILQCVPQSARLPLNGSCATSIETWDDVQQCLNGPRQVSNQNNHVNREKLTINLIGERNSGTKWVVEEMQKCFKNSINIQRDMWGRSKHFFQRTGWDPLSQSSHIVVAIFRDPVEWVAAMIEKPYHMTEHIKGFDSNNKPIPLPWQEFVMKPWATNRSKYDQKLLKMKQKNPRKYLPCRTGMDFHEVIPCRFDKGAVPEAVTREQNPVYELKRGGFTDEPYRNIMELRSDKIVNFLLEVPVLVALRGYLAVRYEDLIMNGTSGMLQQIGKMVGIDELPASCRPQAPRPARMGKRIIPPGLRRWVRQHQNNDTERLLGYG